MSRWKWVAWAGIPAAVVVLGWLLLPRDPAPGAAGVGPSEARSIRGELPRTFLEAVDREHDLHGVVRDPQGRPVAGAAVRVLSNPVAGFDAFDFDLLAVRRTEGETVSGVHGEFSVRAPRGESLSLLVEAPGYPMRLLAGRQAGEFVPVVLEAGATVRGRIVAGTLREPVRSRVRVFTRESWIVEFEQETDASGQFVAERLSPGPRLFEVIPLHGGSPAWRTLELAPGAQVEESFQVPSRVRFTGHVVDAETDEPIAGAEVSETWSFWYPALTDAEGRFELAGIGGQGFGAVVVRAPGYGRRERMFPQVPSQVFEAEIRLEPGRRATGRVFDWFGEPIEGALVAAVALEEAEGGRRTDWRTGWTDAAGAFVLSDLRPDLRHVLFVKRRGYGTVVYELPARAEEPLGVELDDVVLPASGEIAGVVVDEAGQGLAGVRVVLGGWNADRGRWNPRRLSSLDTHLARQVRRTDDLGRFRFADLAPGEYDVAPELTGHGPTQARTVHLGRGELREGLRFQHFERGRIEGRVLDPDGRGVSGAEVFARPADPLRGPGVLTRTGTGGHFRFEGLEPGGYVLAAHARYGDDDSATERPRLCSQRREGVAAGGEPVKIVLPRAAAVTGRVLDAAGRPVAGAEVRALDAAGGWLTRALCDGSGGFALDVPVGERVDLLALGRSEAGPAFARLDGVAAGREGLTLQLAAPAPPEH